MRLAARWMKISFLIIVLSCSGIGMAQPAPAADDVAANAAVAERMCQFAQSGLLTRQIVPATMHQAIAALKAANKLNPTEPRFLRLLTEAYLQIGGDEGRDGAIDSLSAYLRLMPADMGAQCQLIDTKYSTYETSTERKKFLDGLLARNEISAPVKSHIAVLSAKLAEERSEDNEAKTYIDQALQWMPLSPEALRFKFHQVDRNGTPLQSITLLFQMLRANPAQPAAMLELGSELADAGVVDPSLNWYRNGFDLNAHLGIAPDPAMVTAYTAELLIADQSSAAQTEAKKLLDKDPSNVEAAILSLLVDKRSGADKTSGSVDTARSAMLARLSRLSAALRGDTQAPASQPTTAPDVDIAGDVKKLLDSSNTSAKASYASSLADLAWLEIYFNGKTADAQQYLTPLRQLIPADSVIMARLEGWSFLVDGKNDEARVKLSAVADRDPLAALGMIQLDKDKPAATTDAAAKKLLTENASGMMGALLMEGLRTRFGLMPAGPDAAAIRAQISAFPTDWLDFLDFSKVHNFYSLKADTTKIAYNFGEPVIARVTISNISKYDITIGPDGAIHPDIWIDVKLAPVANQNLSGVALDRLSQKLILHPRESVDTVLRADQGALGSMLEGSPNLPMAMFFSVLTNPLSQQGGIAPGPGGYREQFSHTVVRNATAPKPEIFKALFARVQDNSPGDVRVRTLELLGSYALTFKAQDDPALKSRAIEILDFIRKGTSDPVPAVRAVATYITAILSDAQVKEGLIRQMLSDSWYAQRMLGIAAIQQAMEAAQIKELLKPLADNDPDPIVKQFAASTMAVADLTPPTTAPTTGPTTQDSSPSMPNITGGAIGGVDVGTAGK